MKQIIFKVYHDDHGSNHEFEIVLFPILFISNQVPEICCINIEKISWKPMVKDGVYVVAEDIPAFMSKAREGLHIAYGLI